MLNFGAYADQFSDVELLREPVRSALRA